MTEEACVSSVVQLLCAKVNWQEWQNSNKTKVINCLVEICHGNQNAITKLMEYLKSNSGENIGNVNDFLNALFRVVDQEDEAFFQQYKLNNYNRKMKCNRCRGVTYKPINSGNCYQILLKDASVGSIEETLIAHLFSRKDSFYCETCHATVKEGGEESVTVDTDNLVLSWAVAQKEVEFLQLSQSLEFLNMTLSGVVFVTSGQKYLVMLKDPSNANVWKFGNESLENDLIFGLKGIPVIAIYSKNFEKKKKNQPRKESTSGFKNYNSLGQTVLAPQSDQVAVDMPQTPTKLQVLVEAKGILHEMCRCTRMLLLSSDFDQTFENFMGALEEADVNPRKLKQDLQTTLQEILQN
mmetsp:Transcript_16733/g.23269  ORF Transcript_16733/g.23269 Transcript_16733/m.23269 type:complete len:352 (+) Transcript_16733:23-1078(+)